MNHLIEFADTFSSIMSGVALFMFYNALLSRRKLNDKITPLVFIAFSLLLTFLVSKSLSTTVLLSLVFVMCLAITFIYKSRISLKIFASTSFVALLVLAEALTRIVIMLVSKNKIDVVLASAPYYVESVLASKVLLLITVKAVQYRKLPESSKISLKNYLPMMTMPITTLFIIYLMSEYAYNIQQQESAFLVALAAAMLIVSNVLIFYLLEKQIRQDLTEQKSTLMQQQLQYQTQYYKELSDKFKLSNKTIHDTKNKLFAISIDLSNNDLLKAKRKIDELCNNVLGDSDLIRTGNDALDALLNTKYRDIKYNDIEFKYNVFINQINLIDDIDLCVIVGNAMDNAIEACMKLSDNTPKKIALRMMQADEHLAIRIKNTASGNLKNINGNVLTDKKEKHLHGFGLQSIEEIVNKYNGNLSYTQDEGIFTLNIYMQNHIELPIMQIK